MKRKTATRIAIAMIVWGTIGGWMLIEYLTGWKVSAAGRDWVLLVNGLTLLIALNHEN